MKYISFLRNISGLIEDNHVTLGMSNHEKDYIWMVQLLIQNSRSGIMTTYYIPNDEFCIYYTKEGEYSYPKNIQEAFDHICSYVLDGSLLKSGSNIE